MNQIKLKCPGCESFDILIFIKLNTHKTVKSSWGVQSKNRTIYKCKSCDLKFVDVSQLNTHDEMSMYDQSYHEMMSGDDQVAEEKSGSIEQSLERLALIKSCHSSGRLLDIGASTGIFLEKSKELGYDVYGLEPSLFACEYARKKLNLSVDAFEQGDISSSTLLKNRMFNVITLWDVIEHFYNVNQDFEKVERAMDKDGIVVIRTPNSDSIFFLIANLLYYFSLGIFSYPVQSIYHSDHQIFFNKKSLTSFLRKFNLKILSVKNESLTWKRFKYCECRRHFLVNLALALFYWLGRLTNHGHGLIIVAKKN